jgi:tRNA threonylcarbamoyladenosine biosynthesis protein TsaB
MSYLFVDSCEFLSVGLLSDELQWLDYDQNSVKKNSEFFHSNLQKMLSRNQKKLSEISGVFQVAGPGSYTGMRLSEGFCQILEWQKLPIFSFYHFEVPALCGIKKGIWVSEAFKGELFCYTWNGEENNTKLIAKDGQDVSQWIERFYGDYEYVFTHFAVDGFDCEYSSGLIKKNAPALLGYVKENSLRRESYYYRPLDVEFKVTQRDK